MRAVSIIGPSQSGKSTLVDALAGLEGGRAQNLKLMGDTRAVTFSFMEERWAALDIPGGLDNFSQVGPALAASDVAVLCVPAEVDAAVLSAPYLRVLEDSGIPTILYVNKIDVSAERVADIVSSLQTYCRHGIVLRQVPMRSGDAVTGAIDLISERAWEYHDGQRSSLIELPKEMADREHEARADLLEHLADFDDHLLEQIIEDQIPMTGEIYEVATRALQHHDLIPGLLGAASHGNGILRLMKTLRHEVPEPAALRDRLGLGRDVIAVGCFADNLAHVGKTVLVRALDGGVGSGRRLGGAPIGGLNDVDARTHVSDLQAGELALSLKSDHLSAGYFFTPEEAIEMPDWARPHAPGLHRLVNAVHERDATKLSLALARLTEIDHGLSSVQDEVTGLPEIGLQGPLHLRRVTEKLENDFGIEVECTDVPAALRETVRKGMVKHYRHRKQSGGAGQFADVVVEISPQPAGSGFSFGDTVKGGAVPKNYIPAVEAGAREALVEGPAGYPVVDVNVTLTDGKAHSVDSSDFAFRTAGKSAVREALGEFGTVVLQPIMNVHVRVPSVFSGGLVQLVSGLKGQVLRFEGDPSATGWDVFHAQLPMTSQEQLSRALSSATRGTAWFSSELDHYEEMRTPVAAHG